MKFGMLFGYVHARDNILSIIFSIPGTPIKMAAITNSKWRPLFLKNQKIDITYHIWCAVLVIKCRDYIFYNLFSFLCYFSTIAAIINAK